MTPFRRFLLIAFFSVGAVAGIIAVLYAVEDWRGARAWAAAKHDLEAKGEHLDWAYFVPPPVPDDQNLAMAPFFVREFRYRREPATGLYRLGHLSTWPDDLKGMPFGGPRPSSLPARATGFHVRMDFAAYAEYFRRTPGFPHPDQPGDPPADVLTALTRYSPALDELALASAQRPLTRFPVDWNTGNPFLLALPHYNRQQEIVTTLTLRASTLLALNRPADALRDLELALRLCRDLGNDPVLIAHLVQLTCLRSVGTPVWEGLADGRWSAAELIRLQADLQGFDLLAGYRFAIRGDRALSLSVGIDYLSSHLGELPSISSAGGSVDASQRRFYRVAGSFVPPGWYASNKAMIAQFLQDYGVEEVDPAAHRVLPSRFDSASPALGALPLRPTNLLAKLTLPVYSSVGVRAARMQATLDQAVVACALERFFLDHKSYPAALAELVPSDLDHPPTDLIDGAPLRYVQTPDGRYRLYSVGWNQRDDGGQVAWLKYSPPHLDDRDGDWVWQYAPFQPPATRERSK